MAVKRALDRRDELRARHALLVLAARRSRRAANTESLSMSRGPTSSRSGTPLLEPSCHTFSPPRTSRSSTMHAHGRVGEALRAQLGARACGSSRARAASRRRCGRSAGSRRAAARASAAARGRRRRSASSSRPPISRVDTPQLRRPGVLLPPFWSRNLISLALAKFWPRKWRRAGLQRLAVLHHRFDAYVRTAPGKRSPAVFSPLITGIAIALLGERRRRRRASAASLRPPPPRWRARCGLPARGTRSCAGTGACAAPSARRWPID